MTITLPATLNAYSINPFESTDQEFQAAVDLLSRNPRVSSRDAARIQDPDVSAARLAYSQIAPRYADVPEIQAKPEIQTATPVHRPIPAGTEIQAAFDRLVELIDQASPDRRQAVEKLIGQYGQIRPASWVKLAKRHIARIEARPYCAPQPVQSDIDWTALEAKKGPQLDWSARARVHTAPNPNRGAAVPHAGKTSLQMSKGGKSAARGGKNKK